jgi:hypothetical protein
MPLINHKNSDSITMPLIAEAAVTANRFVIFGTADAQVDMPGNDNDPILGVALNTAAIGEVVDVQITGVAKVQAGGSVSRGNLVACEDVTGRALAITVGATTGDQRVGGKALSDADDEDFVSVLLAGGNDYVAV